MQVKNRRRSNDLRSSEMRLRLLDAARTLFIELGYLSTSTPAIVKAAGVTRGALYHHFSDKKAVFEGVIERESKSVAIGIDAFELDGMCKLDQLIAGASGYLIAMLVAGRTRLLLVDGPAVLGRDAMRRIEAGNGDLTLREGLEDAMACGELPKLPVEPLTSLLSAMFERSALDIADGGDMKIHNKTLSAILVGLSHLSKSDF